ncbi:MAG TPA: spherulation-specific family 4 protein, partial [Nitrososphaerales archaeon]|nr:spherulation-specific family 4 protein [Nitrososphaerales archaeon]
MKSNAALAAFLVDLLLAGFVSALTGPQAAVAAQPPGILVPLYSAPGSQWNELIAAKNANPSVPIIAIINPSNGPGPSVDQAFQQGVQGLKSAGVIVVGYVATGYGSQPISTVEGWISDYQQWYGVSGIFFDEMADTLGYQVYYQTLGTFVTSCSMQYTIGNPGTTLPGAFAGLLGIYVVAEDSYAVAPGSLIGAVGVDPPGSLSVILSSVPSTNQTYVDSLLSSVGWIYMTDQGAPDPYVILSSYFDNLVDMAAKAAGVASTTDMVTVDSIDTGGSPLPGFWTTVASNGVSIASGNTPLTFSAVSGQTYQVTSSNSGFAVLTKWSTGATTSTISLDTQQNIVIAAIYSLGPTVKVTVETVAANGSAISGLWTTINQEASVIASGYTPATFSVVPGIQYNVTVANFANLVFDHWGTGQSTSSLLF